MTNDKMRECGQACAFYGKYLGMAGNGLAMCSADKFAQNLIRSKTYGYRKT